MIQSIDDRDGELRTGVEVNSGIATFLDGVGVDYFRIRTIECAQSFFQDLSTKDFLGA